MRYQNKLKEARENKGLTQMDVVKKTGIAQALISRQEGGHVQPNLYNAVQLSQLYGVPIKELFHGYFEEKDEEREK